MAIPDAKWEWLVGLDLPTVWHRNVLGALARAGTGAEAVKTADQIAEAVGVPKSRTNIDIREMVRDLRRAGVPVISCPKGFYLAETLAEVAAGVRSLRRRATQILDTAMLLEDGGEAWFAEQERRLPL